MKNKQPRPWVLHKGIRFIWPFISLDNSNPDMYVPVCAPQTVTEARNNVLVKNGPFPWNADQNIKTPLANKSVLGNSFESTEETFTSTVDVEDTDSMYVEGVEV